MAESRSLSQLNPNHQKMPLIKSLWVAAPAATFIDQKTWALAPEVHSYFDPFQSARWLPARLSRAGLLTPSVECERCAPYCSLHTKRWSELWTCRPKLRARANKAPASHIPSTGPFSD